MKPILGILGGMGPLASSRFYELFIQISVERFSVTKNVDFPHLLLDSIPVPDLVRSQDDAEVAVQMIEEEAQRLVRAGAMLLAMTCNTMHLYEDRIREAVDVPFLSMIAAVTECVRNDGRKRIGLLGSMTTMQSTLYRSPLERSGIEVLVPADSGQEKLGTLIHAVIAGHVGESERKQLRTQINALMSRGCDAVILGCTELPLLIRQKDVSIPLYDSLQILAGRCAEECFSRENNP